MGCFKDELVFPEILFLEEGWRWFVFEYFGKSFLLFDDEWGLWGFLKDEDNSQVRLLLGPERVSRFVLLLLLWCFFFLDCGWG